MLTKCYSFQNMDDSEDVATEGESPGAGGGVTVVGPATPGGAKVGGDGATDANAAADQSKDTKSEE